MARATKAQTILLDDQVGATIRDLGQATTGQVRAALGPIMLTRANRGIRCACRCGEVSHQRHTSWTGHASSDDVRPSLRRLAKKGLVVEIKTPAANNHGGHLWLWVGGDS